MVRSDSADEEQIIIEDGYDLMEEDEDMNTGTGALPVIIPEWNAAKSSQLITAAMAAAEAAASAAAAATSATATATTTTTFEHLTRPLTPPNLRTVVLPTSTIGHAPLLTNRSISQPAPLSPASVDPDRRLRRQIANCNERRRMQSINAGFMALRSLLPRKFQEGEKLSKAAILQQTAEMVQRLLDERKMTSSDGSDAKKPKLDDDFVDSRSRTIQQLQMSLENERNARKMLEQQVAQLQELLQKKPPKTSKTMTTKQKFNTPSPPVSTYVTPSISTVFKESSPERKSSNDIDSSSPLSMLNLNGSPSSSEAIVGAAPKIKMNPSLAGIESTVSTVIRPTPLAPINVEISSPSLSTPSPLTVNQQHHSIMFPTQTQPQSSLLLANALNAVNAANAANAVNAVQSTISTGNSTPVTIPNISILQSCQTQPSAFVSTQTSIAAHHSLQTILNAIRHLEGSPFMPSSPPPPPTSQTSLVR